MRAILATTLLCLLAIAGSHSPANAQHPEWYERVLEAQRQTGAVKGSQFAAPISGKPTDCPSRWCGCWLGKHLGINDRSLWLARNWARVGRPAHGPAPGVIVVWRGHVGKITAVEGPGRIRVLSGNDGRAVRERVRSTAGVIAYRFVS